MLERPVIFLYDDSSCAVVDEQLVHLADHDRQRVEKITSKKKKAEFLKSRILLYSILENYFKIPSKVFSKSPHGKPFLKGVEMSMSMSHSANKFAFAFAKPEISIGIDVEGKSIREGTLKIAEKYFSPIEVEQLEQQVEQEAKNKLFRQFWSLKESYYKVCDFESAMQQVLALSFDLQNKKIFFNSDEAAKCKFQFMTYADLKYSLSVCLLGATSNDLKFYKCQSLSPIDFQECSEEFLNLST